MKTCFYIFCSMLVFANCSITEIYERCATYKNLFGDSIAFPKTPSDPLQPGDFPHDVVIGYAKNNSYNFLCSGVIVSKKYVLVPAHCVLHSVHKPSLIRVGIVSTPFKEAQSNIQSDFKIKSVKPHPDYSKKTAKNNIALVELEDELEFNDKVRPACLDTKKDSTDDLILTEWAKQENNTKLALSTTDISVVANEKCKTQYLTVRKDFIIDNSQICAVAHCARNVGGTIQVPNGNLYTVVALPSFGPVCSKPTPTTIPDVYTKINAYLDWIETIVWS